MKSEEERPCRCQMPSKWSQWEPDEHWAKRNSDGQWPHGMSYRNPAWQNKRSVLLRRFIRIALSLALLFFGGTALVSFLITRLFGGDGNTAAYVWLGLCGILLALPILGVIVASRLYNNFARPLAHVMAAADAVAEGDLSVRVDAQPPGEVGKLVTSFNRMTEELERTDQQRRNLTADVAHELRTPLHIIQGNLEGIIDGVYEPTQEHIEATLEETRALARLVADLRTLAQAEAGQLPLVYEPVNVHDLLSDLETSFSGQAEAAGLTLRVEDEALPANLHLYGDAGRLDQVFSNLIVNAIRHTHAGGVTLRAEGDADRVCIAVRDTGEGIAAANLPFIFDRFWRGDRARTHAGGIGGGLGLAIARQLVAAHGGHIAVESEVGGGTEFRVSLPGGGPSVADAGQSPALRHIQAA